jgi:hypothetical protein
MATSLSNQLGRNESFESKQDNETVEKEVELQLSMQEKLTRVIGKEINSKIIFVGLENILERRNTLKLI